MAITPSEIMYWEILPAIRKELVVQMKEGGLKQKEIADLFEITPSAISQYLNNKRGDFEFTDAFKKKINEGAKRIQENTRTPFEETNYLIKEFDNSREICIVCRDKNGTKKSCSVCYE